MIRRSLIHEIVIILWRKKLKLKITHLGRGAGFKPGPWDSRVLGLNHNSTSDLRQTVSLSVLHFSILLFFQGSFQLEIHK